jgi:hypothetical protein
MSRCTGARHVREECLDVAFLLTREVVNHVRVLPHVHREDDGEAAELPLLMVADPRGVNGVVEWVGVEDGPSDATAHADRLEVLDERVDRPILFTHRFREW